MKTEEMKIVYIAHPINGDVAGNLAKILVIVKRLNKYPNIVPFVPYFADCSALDDNDPLQRAKGIANDKEIIESSLVSACLLYGDRLTPGMINEVRKYQSMGVIVIPMTDSTTQGMKELKLLEVDPMPAWRNLIYPYWEMADTDEKPKLVTAGNIKEQLAAKVRRDICKK